METICTFRHHCTYTYADCVDGQNCGLDLYPIKLQPMVVLVPEALPHSDFTTYLRTLTNRPVMIYSLATVAIVIMALALTSFGYKKNGQFLLLQRTADVVNLLLNDNDLYHSPLPLYVINDAWKNHVNEMLSSQLPHSNWSEKISVIDASALRKEMFTFNRSISSVLELERLNIKDYRILDVIIFEQYYTYHVDRDCPFTERINEMVHQSVAAGLLFKCDRTYSDLVENLVVNDYYKQLSLQNGNYSSADSFEMPAFVFYGWAGSICVFAIELIWMKFLGSSTAEFRKR